MKKKLIASVLAALMVTSMVPAAAFAQNDAQSAKNVATPADATSESAQRISKVEKLIDAIVDETKYSTADATNVDAAQTAFEKLSIDEQRQVNDTKKTKLNAAVANYKGFKDMIAEVDEAFKAIETVTLDDYGTNASIAKAEGLYQTLLKNTAIGGDVMVTAISAEAAKNRKNFVYNTDGSTNGKAVKEALEAIDAMAAPSEFNNTNYLVTGDAPMSTYITAKNKVESIETTYNMDRHILGNVAKYDTVKKKVDGYTADRDAVVKMFVGQFNKTIGTGIGQVSLEEAEALWEKVNEAAAKLSEKQRTENISSVCIKTEIDNRKTVIDAAKKAQTVTDKLTELKKVIAAFSDPITLKDEAVVKEARELLDEITALGSSMTGSAEETAVVAAENTIKTEWAKLSIEEQTQRLLTLTAKLPKAENATIKDKENALAAMAEYNLAAGETLTAAGGTDSAALSQLQQQKDVAMARNNIKGCLEVINDQEVKLGAAKGVYEALSIYATVDDSNVTAAEKALKDAKKLYDELKTQVQKDMFNTDDTYKLARETYAKLEESLNEYKKIPAYEQEANRILLDMKYLTKDFDDAANVKALNDVKQRFEAADKAVQEIVKKDPTYKTYLAVLKEYNETQATGQAPAVEKMIAELPMVKTDATAAELDAAMVQIKAAKDALEAIDEDSRDRVKNAGRIGLAEKAVKAAAAHQVNELIKAANLGNTTGALTDVQKEKIATAKAMYTKYELAGSDLNADTANAATDYDNAVAKYDAEVKDETMQEILEWKTLVNMITDGTVTKNDIDAVFAAQNKYDSLSAAAKDILKGDEYKELVEKLGKAYAQAQEISLDNATIDAIGDQVYTGEYIEPEVTVKDVKGNVIDKDQYNVFYKNHKDVGTATVSVTPTADGKYVGKTTVTFNITARDLKGARTSQVHNYLYTGKGREQTGLKVYVDNRVLKKDTDYTVKYTGNKNVGNATMTITGKGNYKGTKTIKFKVIPNKIKSVTATSTRKNAMKITVKPVAADKTQKVKYRYQFRVKGTTAWKTLYSSKSTVTLGSKSVKSGKTYQVKVCAYKGAKSTYVQGPYSEYETVRVK